MTDEVGDESEIDNQFVPVRPGTYEFYVEGMQADGILATFVVK